MKICKLLQSCMRAAILFESISFSPQQFHTCYVYMYIVYYVLFIHCYCNLPIFSQLRDRKLSCTDKISISIIVRRQYGTSFTVARNSQPHTHTQKGIARSSAAALACTGRRIRLMLRQHTFNTHRHRHTQRRATST